MNEREGGWVQVHSGEIKVVMKVDGGIQTVRFDKVTMESLLDAASILGNWLEVPYEDRVKEVRRLHDRDQFGAAIRDELEGFGE